MRNERARILELLREGKITVEEAEQLLDALGTAGAEAAAGGSTSAGPTKARHLHVRVTNTQTGQVKTDIRIPARGWALLTKLTRTKLGRRMGGLALEDIERAAREGATGHVLDSTNEERGERVEIYFD
ncbi:MAG: hypothetical protein IIC89_00875 [Chloroflexi bacterium]|nr:hypothetical protein [Chloroflexota bacterium]